MLPHLEGHEIAFNASDRKSWKRYARSMDEYLRCEWTPPPEEPDGLVPNATSCRLVNPETFPLSVLAGHAGRGSPFVGRAQPLNVFFFLPSFCHALLFCQSSLIRGLWLAERWLRPEFIDALLFAHSPPVPLRLLSIFQRTTTALRRRRTCCAQRRNTSYRMIWRRAPSGKRVSSRGPGWGIARG